MLFLSPVPSGLFLWWAMGITFNYKLTEPVVKALKDGKTWELVEDFVVHLASGHTVYVPAGFQFDFASVPRITWTLVGSPATGKHRTAAIAHDWLCETGYDWVKSAEIFLEIMEMAGTNWFKRNTMYWAVRMHQPFANPVNLARVAYLKNMQARRITESGRKELGYIL